MVIVKEIIRTYYSCDETTKLDVDSAISTLSEDGTLTEVELLVIAITKEQYSLTAASEVLGISKSAVGRILDIACHKIAIHLGSEYQDIKIFKRVEDRLGRKLTPEEEFFCWKKMRDLGRNKYDNISIFNFKVTKDGEIIGNGEDKTKR
jgi:hypothetical protein